MDEGDLGHSREARQEAWGCIAHRAIVSFETPDIQKRLDLEKSKARLSASTISRNDGFLVLVYEHSRKTSTGITQWGPKALPPLFGSSSQIEYQLFFLLTSSYSASTTVGSSEGPSWESGPGCWVPADSCDFL